MLGQIAVGITYLSVAVIALFTYYRWLKKRIRCVVSRHVFALGVLLLIPAAMHLSWGLGMQPFSYDDAYMTTGMFAVIISIVLLLLAYQWTGNRNLLYLQLVYAGAIVGGLVNQDIFFNILLVSAFIISFLVFLDLFIITSHHVRMGSIFGVCYAASSLIVLALSTLGSSYWLWAVPNVFLAISIFMIYKDGKYCMLLHPVHRNHAAHRGIVHLVFLRYLAYTVAIASLIFISTVSIHELGHALSSSYYGCEQTRIVFDLKAFPHTEIICSNERADITVITLAGILATTAMSSVLLLSGERFAFIIGKLLLAYGALISSADLNDLGLSEGITTVIGLCSVLALIFIFIDLSKYYLANQNLLLAGRPKKIDLSFPRRLQTFLYR